MHTKTHRIPGLILKDHEFTIPLDHNHPEGEQITVFGREIVAPDQERNELPWLIFFQGGPGFSAPRPKSKSGWLKLALKEYRVFLIDQRGTGHSAPVLPQTLSSFSTPQDQADYLKHFRADAIVQDAEWIRRDLLGENQKWSALGQSYGGFCITHYLSAAPEGLREAIITGGIPPQTDTPDEVYRATFQRVIDKNQRYYARYPDDVELVHQIIDHLEKNIVNLPGGSRLSARRFQQLGLAFGASDGLEDVHYLLENAFVQGNNGKELSYTFLRGFENALPFETNPIFALLHEAIYCQGCPSNWSAERIQREFPEFEFKNDQPIFFTGEMIYPWMFNDYEHLRPFKTAADILATYTDWPQLYDLQTLRANEVPCVAAVYYDDMYVDRLLSENMAKNINGIELWITNEHEHSALRLHGEEVFKRLIQMLRGEV
ncbi:MAG: alpha/beta fold hydrolase [Anaerolineales bacterium]|nr:alpha/beta fold hydrolase [Anaerolineales bacterium]